MHTLVLCLVFGVDLIVHYVRNVGHILLLEGKSERLSIKHLFEIYVDEQHML